MKNYQDYKIEDFAKEIYENSLDNNDMLKRIGTNSYTTEQVEEIKKKIDYAIKRINQPLSLNEKIIFFLFPFGIRSMLTLNNNFIDIEKELEQGYFIRVNQYHKYSLLGVVFYVLLFVAFML